MKALLTLLAVISSLYLLTACNNDDIYSYTTTNTNNYATEICDANISYDYRINLDENSTAFSYPTSLVIDCYLTSCDNFLAIILESYNIPMDDINFTDDNVTDDIVIDDNATDDNVTDDINDTL